jgi:hypothetical protein
MDDATLKLYRLALRDTVTPLGSGEGRPRQPAVEYRLVLGFQ